MSISLNESFTALPVLAPKAPFQSKSLKAELCQTSSWVLELITQNSLRTPAASYDLL